MIFGITGSIACGKTTVTNFIRNLDIPVVDADEIAHKIVQLGTFGLDEIINAFGNSYLLPDGNLDRLKLGRLVFADSNKIEVLDRIMIPLIQAEADARLQAYVDAGYNLVGYDAALLIEQGRAEKFRPLVVVTAPRDTQIDRLMRRNGLTEDEACNRIDRQLSSEEKAKYADYVITTTGTLEELEQKVLSVVSNIKSSFNCK